MKRKTFLRLCAFLILINLSAALVLADTIEYPFKEIKITEVTTFKVTVPEGISTTSVFSGLINPGETVTIYVATLEMIHNIDEPTQGTMMILVTDHTGLDLVRYIINDYSNDGQTKTWGFANHILIDPEIGIIKDTTLLQNSKELKVIQTQDPMTWRFADNALLEYPTIDNSVKTETGLSVIVEAYIDRSTLVVPNPRIPQVGLVQALKTLAMIGLPSLTGCATKTVLLDGMIPLGHESLTFALAQAIKTIFR